MRWVYREDHVSNCCVYWYGQGGLKVLFYRDVICNLKVNQTGLATKGLIKSDRIRTKDEQVIGTERNFMLSVIPPNTQELQMSKYVATQCCSKWFNGQIKKHKAQQATLSGFTVSSEWPRLLDGGTN